ncbi:unnamed protein product [Phytophthora fragariaefolia]|uniref:Unnamed protein product n=1 Tax=Phytophthora fragariaefolia TaxID=1490495 RepID=A0A9W7D240_9STRA|nr:unnamed protein product [Phytophthora fragariaefolia]
MVTKYPPRCSEMLLSELGRPTYTSSNFSPTPSSIRQADYAILESSTPVECTPEHHQQVQSENNPLQKVSQNSPMPKILSSVFHSPSRPAEKTTINNSCIALLDGSTTAKAKTAVGTTGLANSLSQPVFLPIGSALNANFHPATTSTPNPSRPSRLMNQAELYQLNEQLWKASRGHTKATSAPSITSPRTTHHLSLFDQTFNTSWSTAQYYETTSPTSSREGVRAFIEATFAANGVEFLGDFDYDAVVDKIFGRCHQPDKMTYSEFKNAFGAVVTEADDDKSKVALGRLSVMAETQRWKEIVRDNPQSGRWCSMKKFCRRYHAEIFWLTLYFLLMVGVFIAKASRFPFDPAVGNCPRIAKGFAEVCLVNTMFVLLPMCRNFVTGLRTLPVAVNYLPIDHHIEFHKVCGVVLLLAALGRTVAWVAIVVYFRTVSLTEWEASRYHHLAFVRDENLMLFALRLPIWTGVAMLICAAIAAPLCLEKVRRGKFNLFWVSHMLFIPFIVLMAFHGFARWVAAPQAHYWALPPIIIYLIEKRYRMTQVFGGQTKIAQVQFSKDAVAIFMRKPKSFSKRQRFLPGMYVFVNVPTISKFEWHPFTISSAPEDKFISLHIHKAGDWTGALYDHLQQLYKQHEISRAEDQGNPMVSPYPTVFIDGPIGSPAQDYSRYREVVLIGAGIGVTPFASILRSIMHQLESYRCPQCGHVRFPPSFQLRKIYFYWVTREQESLTWFTNTMNQLSKMDTDNHLEIHNFFSSVKNEAVIAPLRAVQNFIHDTEGQDIISGLQTKQRTHFGRPDWKAELTRVVQNHRRLEPFGERDEEREEIGVFFCGPKSMGSIIDEHCTTLNQAEVTRSPDVEFVFHSENF